MDHTDERMQPRVCLSGIVVDAGLRVTDRDYLQKVDNKKRPHNFDR